MQQRENETDAQFAYRREAEAADTYRQIRAAEDRLQTEAHAESRRRLGIPTTEESFNDGSPTWRSTFQYAQLLAERDAHAGRHARNDDAGPQQLAFEDSDDD